MSSGASIPTVVLVERLRSRESVPLTTNTFRCNERFQEFCALVMPDLASTRRRERDPDKEEKVRQAAERAIKEIRTYGFELRKAEAIEKTSERDMEEYRQQGDHIKESIKAVQEEMGKLKEGLAQEKKKRFHKELYEETCKDINRYPPYVRTKKATEKLSSELLATREKQKAVQSVQRLKQKQIALLMQSLADIQAAVHEEDIDEGPTTGALEPVHPNGKSDEAMMMPHAAHANADAEANGVADVDADAEGGGVVEQEDGANGIGEDGEVQVEEGQEEGRKRSRRKLSPSVEESKDNHVESGGKPGLTNGAPHAGARPTARRSSGLETEEMSDVL